MRQLITGVILAVLLVGCAEKPKFSINESDTSEAYENNPAFTKIKLSTTINNSNNESGSESGYEFTNAPISVHTIETGDLDVLGGIVIFKGKGTSGLVLLTIKGKESFDKLEKRINKLKDFVCIKTVMGRSVNQQCAMTDPEPNREKINLMYNGFVNITSLNYIR